MINHRHQDIKEAIRSIMKRLLGKKLRNKSDKRQNDNINLKYKKIIKNRKKTEKEEKAQKDKTTNWISRIKIEVIKAKLKYSNKK